ncbi:dGTPase [Sulfurivirga caldicuralii]|uniref:Deoxyguanosinetriphosphate triphosphohydrolase-like protein n=1 Tax=Sulfurivirga caldicuralii TaxID=364032 RepID=A0A1N6F2R5_9GAMM|nr:anti-phage deoxyguanosine triphosphatase [Sulfurivirga caldicuralii]SIN89580.1 dGTPase [Sulfurivirga caldicuralii]
MQPHPDAPEWAERYTDFLSGQPPKPARVVYQRDRARIIHSASFRRLQSKTQVLGLHESDFYRTRLTHSMEVAQIGSGLVEQLSISGEGQPWHEWLPNLFLIEAICLAHDLGHPPFGHGGEMALNYMMRRHGGFEGNAQTLRILTKLGEYTAENGINLSRRATLGVLKYPVIYDEIVCCYEPFKTAMAEPDAQDYLTLNPNHYQPPKSIFLDEKPEFEWVLAPFSPSDRERFTRIERVSEQQFTRDKAFDTTIMDLADDIAYGIHDLEDALAMNMISREAWEDEVVQTDAFRAAGMWTPEMDDWLFSGRSRPRKRAISLMVGMMIEAVEVVENPDYEHPLLRYQARLRPEAAAVLDLLKRFVFKWVITLPEVKGLEYKGQLIVLNLFKALWGNADRLLPRNTFARFEQAETERAKRRVVCDYIAGMSNVYAARLYNKLFSADAGSIFDRL